MTGPVPLPVDGLRSLADRVVAAYRAAAPRRPVLPAGARGEVVRVLTRALLEDETHDAYAAAVTAARRRAGVHRELLAAGGPDQPAELVARDGLAALGDDLLADLALSPQALADLRARLYDDPDLDAARGRWFFDPLPVTGEPEAVTARASSTDAVVTTPTAVVRRVRGWPLPALAALAAGVFLAVGVLIGSRFGGREADGRLFAEARTRPDPTRGPGDFVIEVENSGDRRAFVTIVALGQGRQPVVQASTREGNRAEWLVVGPGAARRLIPPAGGAQAFLVVLTPVPAADVVREVVAAQPVAAQPDAVRAAVVAELQALGYPSFHTVVVRPPAGTP